MHTKPKTKTCRHCGEAKPVEEYYYDRCSKTYRYICKPCQIKVSSARKRDAAHKPERMPRRANKSGRAGITCRTCYWKGLLRGKDAAGAIYRCRQLHLKIRDWTPARRCKSYLEKASSAPVIDRFDNMN